MAECSHEIFLGAYIDGELDEPRRRELEAHVAICPSCPIELRELEELRRAIELAAPKPVALSSEALARLHESVDALAERSLLRFAEALSGIAAGVLIVASASLWVMSPRAHASSDPVTPAQWETAAISPQQLDETYASSASMSSPTLETAEWIVQDLSSRNRNGGAR